MDPLAPFPPLLQVPYTSHTRKNKGASTGFEKLEPIFWKGRKFIRGYTLQVFRGLQAFVLAFHKGVPALFEAYPEE